MLLLTSNLSHSSSEAKKNSRKLHSVMQEILESNHALSTQLRTVMSRQNTMNSVIQDDNNTKPIMNKRSTSTLQQSAEFEAILRKSRPYKHKSHQNNESVVPSRSCPPNPSNWTVRSELSLGELSTSDISDFKLPIYPFDITNPESYQQCNFAGNTYVPDPPPRDDRRGDVVIETTTPRDEMRTSVSEPKSAMQGTVYNLRQIRKQVFPWKLVRIADTDAGVFREDTFRENIFREDIFREDRGTTRDIPKIFCEDLDPGTALPTPPKPEPEHKLKTVAIRGTAAILRRLSVTKKPTEVDETETNHNKSVSDLHTPFSAGDTEEWDGSLRRVMWDGARSSPEESRRNSWSGQIPSHSTSNVWDERWMAVPGGQPTGRRHSSAVDETPTTNSPESTARGETSSLFPPNSSERQFSTYTAILAHAPVDGE